MTSEDIQKLYDLKKKLDAGSISQEAFNKEVAAIRGYSDGTSNNASAKEDTSQENQEPSSKDAGGLSKKNIIIVVVMAAIMVGVIIMGVVYTAHDRNNHQDTTSTMFPDEAIVRKNIERYCNAICNNDFETLSSLYAPKVDRFQDAYDKDREYVLDCHRGYDKKFKVYGKHSSIRWDSFEMALLNNGYVKVSIIEDYSIDRQESERYSVFVLEKHFLLDSSYHIVSVYDKQLSKLRESGLSIDQLAMASFDYLLKDYSRGVSPLDVGEVYDRVDFRKNKHFRDFIRQVVESDSDFQTMMNSNVRSTEFMDMASGKIGFFTIKGTCYTIDFSRYYEEDVSITIKVNGHTYDYMTSGYMSSPLYPGEEE